MGPSLINNAPVGNWLFICILAVCKVGLQSPAEDIVIGYAVLQMLVACKYEMVNEDIVVASENGLVLRGDESLWVTTSSQLSRG